MHELRRGREPTARASELERPQEVVGLLEARSDGVDLVDEVRAALDPHGSHSILDYGVVSDGNALLVELPEPTLENELLDGGSGGVAVSHVGLDETEHTDGRLVELDEGGVVDLTEAEELHNLLGLGGDTDGTPDADDEGELRHGGDVEPAGDLGLAAVRDRRGLGGGVLGAELLGGGDGVLLVGALLLLGLVRGLLRLFGDFGLGGLLLENGLGNRRCHGWVVVLWRV